MWTEFVARLVALSFMAGLLVAGGVAYAALRGPRPSEVRREEAAGVSAGAEAAWLAAVGLTYLYPLGVLLGVPYAYGYFALGPDPWSGVAQDVGLAAAGAGLVLVPWSVRALGRYTTFRIEVREKQPIVEVGPYARVRHPLYSANLLVAVGLAVAFLSPWLAAVAVAVLVLVLLRARTEEAMFLGSPRLGGAYAAYVRRTGRFLPRWPRLDR